MLRKTLLVCFFISLSYDCLYSQALTIDKLTNQLLFNSLKEPDPLITDFVKQYIPSLIESKKNEGTATISSLNKYSEVHAFTFTKHPFLKISFTLGKLEFFCLRNSPQKEIQVSNLKLWLEFDTQQEAEIAFSNLIETCIPISIQKKFSSTNGSQKAEFSDSNETKGFHRIRIRLTADNLDRHTFKLLFETENDL